MPLEGSARAAILFAVLRDRVRQGARAGIVAAAATLGALVGFGQARGAPLKPLNAIAYAVFGTRAYFMTGFDWGVTLAALALHVVALVSLAVLFALVAGHLRGARLLLAALLFSGLVYLFDRIVGPTHTISGVDATLSGPEIGAMYMVLALSLALGVRLADGRDTRFA
jgi:hypothetical protein